MNISLTSHTYSTSNIQDTFRHFQTSRQQKTTIIIAFCISFYVDISAIQLYDTIYGQIAIVDFDVPSLDIYTIYR